MSPIPTPSPDLPLDLWLVLVFLGLSPAMLASWLEARFRGVLARLPLDGYSLVLLVLAAGSYLALGAPPRLLSDAVPAPAAVTVGLLAGAAAIAVDLAVRRLWRPARPRGPRPTPLSSPRVPADVPTGGEVVWRLRDHGPAWRHGFLNLQVPAVLEELVYRQALLALLAPAMGVVGAAVVSTLSFGLIHLYFGAPAVVSKWIMGGLFTALVLSGAGLLSVIVAHCLLNAAVWAVRTGRIRAVPGGRLLETRA